MIEQSQCEKRRCMNYVGVRRKNEQEEATERHVCLAFRNGDGIPLDIAFGDNLHLRSIPGDSGITYEEGTQEAFDNREAQESD